MKKPVIKYATFTIRESVLERLSEVKKGHRWSKSHFVEQAIVAALDDLERKEAGNE